MGEDLGAVAPDLHWSSAMANVGTGIGSGAHRLPLEHLHLSSLLYKQTEIALWEMHGGYIIRSHLQCSQPACSSPPPAVDTHLSLAEPQSRMGMSPHAGTHLPATLKGHQLQTKGTQQLKHGTTSPAHACGPPVPGHLPQHGMLPSLSPIPNPTGASPF